jgi:hypothetical protein
VRLGRIILAALAPLLSLPALAGDVARQDVSRPTAADSRAGLLRSMALFAVSAAESGCPAPAQAGPAAQAVFALEALLVATHFKHSLWLVASVAAFDLLGRQHRRALLRC